MTLPSTTGSTELRDMMIEIRTKLDVLITQHEQRHTDHEARLRTLEQRVDPTREKFDARLTALEVARWKLAGFLSALSALAGAGGALISHLLGGG